MNMLRNSELEINMFSFYHFYLYLCELVTLYAASLYLSFAVVGDDLAAIGKKISVAFVVVCFCRIDCILSYEHRWTI
jgi:hypothetical protein